MPHMGSNTIRAQISKLEYLVRAMYCAPGRNRTYDRQIRRLLLYPLSYGGQATPSVIVRPARDHCSAQIPAASVVVRP
jgi:hypothetical protein